MEGEANEWLTSTKRETEGAQPRAWRRRNRFDGIKVAATEEYHRCPDASAVIAGAEGWPAPAPREWGEAVWAVVRVGNVWYAIGPAVEYCTPIAYCPWCGERLSATSRSPTAEREAQQRGGADG